MIEVQAQPAQINQTTKVLQAGAKSLLDFHDKNKNNLDIQDANRLLVASFLLIELSKTDDSLKAAAALEAFVKELKK